MAFCKLCGKEKKLIRAHIIPDFMYDEIKKVNDNKINMIRVSGGEKPEIRTKRHIATEYDPSILCAECDNGILARYEKYAHSVLYTGKNLSFEAFKTTDGIEYFEAKGVDYNLFKLFILSILWRMSITTRSFASEVSLGEHHEETIRKCLLSGQAPAPDCYSFLIFSHGRNVPKSKEIVLSPFRYRLHKTGVFIYEFVITGITYQIPVASLNYKLPEFYLLNTLKIDGVLRMFEIPASISKNKLNILMRAKVFK